MSPDQENSIKSWSQTRDERLGEISNLTVQRDMLSKQVSDLAKDHTDINIELAYKKGILEGLKTKEEYDAMHRQQMIKEHGVELASVRLENLLRHERILKENISILNDTHETLKNTVGPVKENITINP